MNECLAMILAGGQGSRLGALTKKLAKPAVPFGGKYRLIDFVLSNCAHSCIDTVGVLTQYRPLELSAYIGSGAPWDFDRTRGGIYILPPYTKDNGSQWYKGTANAVYQNMDFIEQFSPYYVLILSGDHIYKMDYDAMLEYHKRKNADVTIAVINVDIKEASRFGIMSIGEGGRITDFEEKPKNPKSTLASMGVYIFNRDVLKSYLETDEKNLQSMNDFGKNVIPNMLLGGVKLYGYRFDGYWRDVGTVESLWQANMDLLKSPSPFNLSERSFAVFSRNNAYPPYYAGENSKIKNCILAGGSIVEGRVFDSVIFEGAYVAPGAEVYNSVIMSDARIEEGASVKRAVVGCGGIIGKNVHIGWENGTKKFCSDICGNGISLLGYGVCVCENASIAPGSMIEDNVEYVENISQNRSDFV